MCLCTLIESVDNDHRFVGLLLNQGSQKDPAQELVRAHRDAELSPPSSSVSVLLFFPFLLPWA